MPLLQDLRGKMCTSNNEITENSNPLKEAKKIITEVIEHLYQILSY
jgi:hypothetical protein